MIDSLVSSWLICGAFMVIISAIGIFLMSFLNTPHSLVELKRLPGFILSRPLFELNIAAASWVLMGWALANGGDSGLFVGMLQFATVGTYNYAQWFFQLSLLMVSVSILSTSTLTKLINIHSRLILNIYYTLGVFSFVFHWAWSAWGWASPYRSLIQEDLLMGCGVLDTAGSSVIHMSAGSAGLVALWFLKTRRISGFTSDMLLKNTEESDAKQMSKNDDNKLQGADSLSSDQEQRGSSMADFDTRQTVANVCSPLLLWIGFIGLNVATNLPTDDASYAAGRRLIMTVVSSSAAFLLGYLYINFNCRDMEIVMKEDDIRARTFISLKCFLSGLVAIGASCSTCELEGAATIGIVAALLCIFVTWIQRKMGIDVSETAVSVHYINGCWGLLAAGFLTSQAGYESTFSRSFGHDAASTRSLLCRGVFYGGPGNQLAANCGFLLAVLSWTVIHTLFILFVLKGFFPKAFKKEKDERYLSPTVDMAVYEKLIEKNEEEKASQPAESVSQKTYRPETQNVDFYEHYGYSWDYVIVMPLPRVMTSDGNHKKKQSISAHDVDNAVKILVKGRDNSGKVFATGPVADVSEVIDIRDCKNRVRHKWVLKGPEDEQKEGDVNGTGTGTDTGADGSSSSSKKSKRVALRKMTTKEKKEKEENIGIIQLITSLHRAHLETKQFISSTGEELIIKIRAPPKEFRYHAHENQYIMLLDEEKCVKAALEGTMNKDKSDFLIKPFAIAHGIEEGFTTWRPHQYIYAPYEKEKNLRKLFKEEVVPPSKASSAHTHPFTNVHRIRLLLSMMTGRGERCAGLNLEELIKNRQILAHYPLHDEEEKESLAKAWLSLYVMPWEQPHTAIRNYLGEQIALYFAFVAHYASFLALLSLAGLGVTIHVIVEAVFMNSLFGSLTTVYSVPAFCIFVAVWSNAMLDHWKQFECVQAFKWGMDQFEKNETDRYEFEGVEEPSYINGKMTKQFPRTLARQRTRFSALVTTLSIMVVLAAVAGVFTLKFYLVNTRKLPNGEVLADFVNSFQVALLGFLYESIADYLNEQENLRTDTEFEDSFIAKLSAFSFVNEYASFFYIAFFKEAVGDMCLQGSCMGELSQTLFIILMTKIASGTATQTLLPRLMTWFHLLIHKKVKDRAGLSQTEKEFTLQDYQRVDIFDDHASRALQFGHLTLFTAAVPFAPIVAFFSNFLEIRVDGFKLLTAYRRPDPQGAQDIGTWFTVYSILSGISVFTNTALVFYTGEYFDSIAGVEKIAAAGFSCLIVFILRSLYSYVYGRTPTEIDIQSQRRDFIVDKLLKQIPDDLGDADDDIVKRSMVDKYIFVDEHDDDDDGLEDTGE